MSQIQTSNWSQTAASNNAASPAGAPEGMAPSGLNDTIRELMSALKIDWCNIHGLDASNALLSSAGSGTTRTLTYGTAPATLYTGLIAGFKAGSNFDAASTLNVNTLGAKNIQKMTGSGYANIVSGDIISGQHVWVKYDGTLDKWIMLTPPGTQASNGTVTSVATAGMATGGTITGAGTVTVSIAAQSELSAVPETDDYLAVYDTSASSHKKVAYSNVAVAASDTVAGMIEVAVQSEMETATSTTLAVTPGRLHNHPAIPKAWCNFLGAATGSNPPTSGYNVASVERTAAGSYTVTFTTAFADTNYIMTWGVLRSANTPDISVRLLTKSVGSCTVRGQDGSGGAEDFTQVHLVFFGDQ